MADELNIEKLSWTIDNSRKIVEALADVYDVVKQTKALKQYQVELEAKIKQLEPQVNARQREIDKLVEQANEALEFRNKASDELLVVKADVAKSKDEHAARSKELAASLDKQLKAIDAEVKSRQTAALGVVDAMVTEHRREASKVLADLNIEIAEAEAKLQSVQSAYLKFKSALPD